MIKNIFFVILLFVHLFSIAQSSSTEILATGNETSARFHSPDARHHLKTIAELTTTREIQEAHLDQRLLDFTNAPEVRKTEIREQIRLILTDIMEINLGIAEAEVGELSAEWKTLHAEGQNHAYMIELESRISAVNNRIRSRRNLLPEIVNRRLEQLLN